MQGIFDIHHFKRIYRLILPEQIEQTDEDDVAGLKLLILLSPCEGIHSSDRMVITAPLRKFPCISGLALHIKPGVIIFK